MNGLRHKGWTAAISFDAADELLVGRLPGTDDVVCFHATAPKLLGRRSGKRCGTTRRRAARRGGRRSR